MPKPKRCGKPASDSKIKEAIKYATSETEVFYILIDGKLNLTDDEVRFHCSEWMKTQTILMEHGKGVYCQEVEA